MANNPYVNKVQLADGTSLIDISGTTAVPSDVAQGKVFFDASGAQQTGTASGGGTTWVTMFDKNVTIYSSSPNYIIVNPYSTPLAANETYRITWGNVTHEFETFADPGTTSYDGYLVGNTGVVGGTDDGSGVALLLYHDRADRMVGVTTDAAGTKYLKIEKKIGGSGGGSDFIVNLTYDDQNDIWSPTCTFAEIQAAYGEGKAIATRAYDSESDNVFESKGFYDDSEEVFYYSVIYPTVYQGSDMECERYHYYSMDSTGTVSDDGYDDMVLTSTLGPKSITANGTYDPLDETPFPLAGYNNVVVNVASGGASNVVTGTFKGTTTGAALEVTLNYSGSGYPVAAMIYPAEGPYNSGSGSFYSAVQRYASAWVVATLNKTDAAPDFSDGSATCTFINRYKSSTSNATSYSGSASNTNSAVFRNSSASSTNPFRLRSATKMEVFIASTSYGFMANINYKYWVLYSS